MQYALLFYNPPLETVPLSDREHKIGPILTEMMAWRKELDGAGVFRTSLRLAGVDTATSLRTKGADVLMTDGPFAETKEILGGFIFIEARDLNEALRIAGGIPMARHGSIEVRPVQQLDPGEA